MFLDVLAIVGYTARSNAGLSHQLKTDLPTQIIWDLSLLHNSQSNGCLLYSYIDQWQMFEMISPYLPLFIHFREKLVHVHQIFILQEQHRKWHHFIKHPAFRDVCVFKCMSHVFGFALADLVSVLAVLWLLDSVVQLSETQAQRRTDVTAQVLYTDPHDRLMWASPLFLGQDEFGEIRVQLVFLVDSFLFYAVPAFLLGHAKSTWDIVSKIQPLFLRQVISWKAFQRASSSHGSYLMSKSFLW